MNTVAQNIAAQLGTKCFAMLGAHSILGGESHLQFAIRGSRTTSKVVVRYEAGLDLYTVEFWKGRSINIALAETVERVYADQLHRVIGSYTKLATSL